MGGKHHYYTIPRQNAQEKSLDKYPMGVYNNNTPGGYHISARQGKAKRRPAMCENCHKTRERSEEEYRRLCNRLSRIEGQIRGIRGMLEKQAYCIDILSQAAAANAALNAFSRELLAQHLRTCVARDLKEGDDGTVEELVSALGKLMK